LKSSELLKKLKKGGFRFLRQGKGSHEIWYNPETGVELVVTNHGSKEVAKGLAEKILKQAGIK
jgi:mRNA interferase HicA